MLLLLFGVHCVVFSFMVSIAIDPYIVLLVGISLEMGKIVGVLVISTFL
jgi:hypothetical protein